jgi:putative endonuclease
MSSGDSTSQRGAASEELAARFLQVQGLVILGRNLRCKVGELDLVGFDGEVLAIVEVRQRSAASFGGAPASVTSCKQRRIIRSARWFLAQRAEWRCHPLRFDVLAVEGPADRGQRILWLKDAFRAT